ncbi:MAG: glycoside hydrolase family 57 protein, partial [Bdellovibrionota bacterium]
YLLNELIQEHPGKFKVSFSITATALQQMEEYIPEAVASFRRLFESGQVELLSETSHHSLAALYSPEEFKQQVALHRSEAIRILGVEPSKVFRNTELITSNAIAKLVEEMGFKAMCMEGADHVLRWRSPLFKYKMAAAPKLMALMKNYRLSDDIAFRFSDRGWSQWPLTSEKFSEWVKMIDLQNPVAAKGGTPFVGLFMDYETFGEHQWESTGIFDFMRALPAKLLAHEGLRFVTPSEAAALPPEQVAELPEIDAPQAFSWADVERDLSAWQGNPIQDAALRAAYRIEDAVRAKALRLGAEKGAELIEVWRRTLTSDHYYYMCTKYFADGDVHKYFNPYESPYDAHIIFMNVMADLEALCGLPGAATEKSIA